MAIWRVGLAGPVYLALALCVCGGAYAQTATPVDGPYVNLGVGGTVLTHTTINDYSLPAFGTNFGHGTAGDIRTGAAPMGGAALGWGFGQGLRIEIEGDYRENPLHSFGGQSAAGSLRQEGAFVNAFWDFNGIADSLVPGLSPYVGVGAGYDFVHFENGAVTGGTGLGSNFLLSTAASDGGFAAQAMVGLAYDIAAVPGLAVTAEYRFTAAPENFNFNGQFSALDISTRANFRTDSFYNQTGLIGLRYSLFPPKPLPAAVTAPEPVAAPPQASAARTYLVFFDWDRADLSPRGRQIVAEAAQASTLIAVTRIEVDGYTDLSGTTAYNQKLSVRRATAVQDELVRDGVKQDEITIQGLGEANPIVPTAKGVREPQNRRVEIILR